MNGADNVIIAGILLAIVGGTIMSMFFFLRSIPKFKEWRDGEKDELWMFLAFLAGGVGTICLAMFYPAYIFESGTSYLALAPVGLVCCLIAVGLGTVYYIFQWLHSE